MTPNGQKYRGLGALVAGMSNLDALKVADMDWKTISMPMLIQGKNENRPSAFRALVRGDNGTELGVSTADYKPVHNEQLFEMMAQAAGAAGVQLERAGCLDEGRRVFAIGTVPNTGFSLEVDEDHARMMRNWATSGHSDIKPGEDRTVLKVLMGAGHVPGMAVTVEFFAERLICSNGAKISKNLGTFRMTHSTKWGAQHVAQIRQMLSTAGVQFKQYEEKARVLRGIRISEDEGRAFVAQLLAPQMFTKMVEQNLIGESVIKPTEATKWGETFNGISTRELLNQIVATDGRRFDVDLFTRPVNRVLELVPTQPGAAMAKDTLWNQYNAVTYFVDHERGRNADSGLNAALFGEGARIKLDAMELATQYAEVIRTR